jgi:hypothetical protein
MELYIFVGTPTEGSPFFTLTTPLLCNSTPFYGEINQCKKKIESETSFSVTSLKQQSLLLGNEAWHSSISNKMCVFIIQFFKIKEFFNVLITLVLELFVF